MKTAVVILMVVASLSVGDAKDMTIGNVLNSKLLWKELVEEHSIPFFTRTKEVFFTTPVNPSGPQQLIKGVIARDLDDTEAESSIIAGGVGSSYVNIKLKSQRGYGLNYLVEFYG